MRAWTGLVSALTTLALLAGVAYGQEPQTTLPDVEDEVMCPVCGTTLELASDSPQALDQRDQIRELIAEGLTKEEIKDELVAEFGPEVLAEPSTEGFDLAAWIVPGLAVVVAGTLAFFAVRRWRGNSLPLSGSQLPHDESPDGAADRERLDQDLKRYEL